MNNILKFSRVQPTHCDICNRIHEHCGMYIILYKNAAYRRCYRSKTSKGVLIYRHVPIYKEWYDVVEKYNRKFFPNMTVSDLRAEIKSVLLQVVGGKESGASSTIILLRGDEYEIQKRSEFSFSIKNIYAYATVDNIMVSFYDVFNLFMNEFMKSRIVFRPMQIVPNAINLFTGYKAKLLDAVDIQYIEPILNHIKVVLANNDENVYEYILDWLAAFLQMRNGRKLGTVLVLYSEEQGAGKNTITSFLRDKVIGISYVAETNDISSIVTKFNFRFANKILTIVNEANNCDNTSEYHKTFDKIKDIIDNKMITIEPKGVNSFSVEDYNHLIINTNNNWPVKIEKSDRRYTILKCDDRYCKDTPENLLYFTNLYRYIEGDFSDVAGK